MVLSLVLALAVCTSSGADRGANGASQDLSALDIVIDDAWLMVTDPAGRRSGFLPGGEARVKEIPGSHVFRDAIDDDLSGEPAGGFTVTVGISQPVEGAYRITVRKEQESELTLLIGAYSSDGSRQPSVELPFRLGEEGEARFSLRFSPAPGSRPRLEGPYPP